MGFSIIDFSLYSNSTIMLFTELQSHSVLKTARLLISSSQRDVDCRGAVYATRSSISGIEPNLQAILRYIGFIRYSPVQASIYIAGKESCQE